MLFGFEMKHLSSLTVFIKSSLVALNLRFLVEKPDLIVSTQFSK